MGPWTKLSREAQLAILAAAIASGSSLACSICKPFIICDPPPPTPTLMICDPPPPSPAQTRTTPKATTTPVKPTATPVQKATPTPTLMICDPPPPSPSQSSSAPSVLPLAHGREARIVQAAPGTLDFAVQRAAPGGDVQWTVSGGTLAALPDDGVRWEPPRRPGRYLLQVVVDWGAEGLAVDSLVLTVTGEGLVIVG